MAGGQRTPRRSGRLLGLLLAAGLVLSACTSAPSRVTIITDDEHGEDGHAAYTPIGRSASPRVHADGDHEPSDEVAVGPGAEGHDAPYVPIASAGSLLVHPGGGYTAAAPVPIGPERKLAAASAAGTPAAVASSASEKPGAGTGASAAQQPAAKPTAPARLSLGPGLGAAPSASGAAPSGSMWAMEAEGREDIATVSGTIEGVVNGLLVIRTDTGQTRVQLESGARIDRDAPGTDADLKPGQFVGVLQAPGGPAIEVRLSSTGPMTPPPGIVPIVGSRTGQVMTFGTIVSLQFGGMVMNTGGQTTTVTVPSNVSILKNAPGTPSDVGIGAQIIATGPLAEDGTIRATTARITAAAPQPAPRR